MTDPLDKVHAWVNGEIAAVKGLYTWMRWRLSTVCSDNYYTAVLEGITPKNTGSVGFTLVCHFDKQGEGWKFRGGWKFKDSANQTLYTHARAALQSELIRLEKASKSQEALAMAYKLSILRQAAR